MTIVETTKSVFELTDENNSFSLSTPKHRIPTGCRETNNKLNELLNLRSQNDVELHVKEIEKRGTRRELENSA